MEVTPSKGKIGFDESYEMTVKIFCKIEKEIVGDVSVMIRGGKVIKIPLSAKTIIPQVSILEEIFDFGNITTLGNAATLSMTLTNQSSIKADMVLDLRLPEENPSAPDGIECLDVIPADDQDDSILHSVHPENEEEEEEQKKQTLQQ